MVASELDWVDAVEDVEMMESELIVVRPADVPSRLDQVESTLIVFGTVYDLADAWCEQLAGVPIVLANRTKRGSTVPVSETYHVDRQEVAALLDVQHSGGRFVAQRIPAETPSPVDLREIAGRLADLTVKQKSRAPRRGSC